MNPDDPQDRWWWERDNDDALWPLQEKRQILRRQQLRALILRSRGLTLEAIGTRLGVSKQSVRTYVAKAAALLVRRRLTTPTRENGYRIDVFEALSVTKRALWVMRCRALNRAVRLRALGIHWTPPWLDRCPCAVCGALFLLTVRHTYRRHYCARCRADGSAQRAITAQSQKTRAARLSSHEEP